MASFTYKYEQTTQTNTQEDTDAAQDQTLRLKNKQLQILNDVQEKEIEKYQEREKNQNDKIQKLTAQLIKVTAKKSPNSCCYGSIIIILLVLLFWLGSSYCSLSVENREKEERFKRSETRAIVSFHETIGLTQKCQMEKKQLLIECELKRTQDALRYEQEMASMDKKMQDRELESQELLLVCRKQFESLKTETFLERERLITECDLRRHNDTITALQYLYKCREKLLQCTEKISNSYMII